MLGGQRVCTEACMYIQYIGRWGLVCSAFYGMEIADRYRGPRRDVTNRNPEPQPLDRPAGTLALED
jgi:hypothetical protein